jgi:hypothetical protein
MFLRNELDFKFPLNIDLSNLAGPVTVVGDALVLVDATVVVRVIAGRTFA